MPQLLARARAFGIASLGGFAHAASEILPASALHSAVAIQAEVAARAHDGAQSRALAARRWHWRERWPRAGRAFRTPTSITCAISARQRGRLAAAVGSARAYAQAIKSDPTMNPGMKAVRLRIQAAPAAGLRPGAGGDMAGAQAVIDATPGDCYDCVRTRGLIAAAAKQWGRADYWFARAVQTGAIHSLRLCRLGPGLAGARPARRGHRQVQARQPERPALRRSAGRLGRGADGARTSRTWRWRNSRKPRNTPPTGAGCISNGARPSSMPASPTKPARNSPAPRPRSHAIGKIRTGAGEPPWLEIAASCAEPARPALWRRRRRHARGKRHAGASRAAPAQYHFLSGR